MGDTLPVIGDLLSASPLGGFGTIDYNKGRLNMPFSGAQIGTEARALGNIGTGGQMRHQVDNTFSTPFAQQLEGYGGMVEGLATGYGAGGVLGGEAGATGAVGAEAAEAPYYAGYTGAMANGAGSSAAGTFSPFGALLGSGLGETVAGLGGASPLSMPQGGAGFGGGGPGNPSLTPQQIAALSAMNSQAHRGLAPSFEARMQGKSPGAGIAGDAFGQFNQGV